MNNNDSKEKISRCCSECSCSLMEAELTEYAKKVQRRIDENDSDEFLNHSELHAAIILRKFIESARKSIYIFCGRLNRNVYGDLLPCFKAADDRGVKVRVVTAYSDVCAEDVAAGLKEMKAYNVLSEPDDETPHFALIDECRYRIETSEEEKSAIVCAYAETREQALRVCSLKLLFDLLLDNCTAESV